MNLRATPFTFVAIAAIAATAASQVRNLSQAEYTLQVQTAVNAASKLSRRSLSVSTAFGNGKDIYVETTKEEAVASDRYHFISTLENGAVTVRVERIRIDGHTFERSGNGKWRSFIPLREGSEFRPIVELLKNLRGQSTYTVTPSILNGIAADLLTVRTTTVLGKEGDVTTTLIWFGKNGLIVKIVKTDTDNVRDLSYFRTTTTFEYGPPGLKIEAPIK